MGSDRIVTVSWKCHHGCFYGECAGHQTEVWYREGAYYLNGPPSANNTQFLGDAGFIDALVEAMTKKETTNV